MKTIKTGGIVCCLFFLFAFGRWYVQHQTPSIRINSAQLDFLPDQRITGLQVSLYNQMGQLTHQLKTPLMTHIPHNDTHWFKAPFITVSEPNQPVWEIQSLEATALHQAEQITFQHQVHMQHHAFNNHPAGLIKTESLCYFPRIKKAITDEKITWVQAGNTIQSKGMTAYLDQQRIDLNEAKAVYALLD